jgi:hypothetical protein
MKTIKIALCFLMCAVLLTACADRETVTQCVSGEPYGFWGGLWHGLIAPFDLICMIWSDHVTVYATNNNGGWYAFGFMLGIGGLGFGGGRSSK